MSRIGKNYSGGGNYPVESAPEKVLKKTSKQKNLKAASNSRLQNASLTSDIKKHCLLPGHNVYNWNFVTKRKEVTLVALNILFPGSLSLKLQGMRNMPESTGNEQAKKEGAFRNLLLKQFEMRQVISDSNCGLRAVICELNPDLDHNSEEITAVILRGDLVDYVKKNPNCIEGGNRPEVLEEYCSKMTRCDTFITLKELEILSDILETPIHIFCYDDSEIDEKNHFSAGKKSIFGNSYQGKKPLMIYYDPLRMQYLPMFRKRVSKFGIFKKN